VQHRQHQLLPLPVAGRVDGMDDQAGPLRRRCDIRCPHGVALHPGDAVFGPGHLGRLRRAAVQRPHGPAA
ncbi:hypothetical protein NPS74_23135, partial [Cutibacterium acnes subsp. acnes]|nr:hypothetical protein [Cutibacterium acnes subsp. acnes]